MNVPNAELGNQLNEHLLKCPQSEHAIDSPYALYSVRCRFSGNQITRLNHERIAENRNTKSKEEAQ